MKANLPLVTIVVFVLLASTLCPPSRAQTPTAVWIEAEKPAQNNFSHFETSSMGKPELLSAGQWIMKGIGAEEVQKLVPKEGIRLVYPVDVPAAGDYRLWARIGWFNAGAAFRWRLGGGTWHDVPKDHPTTNLMEVGFFCEASWADLGQVDLQQGRTTLEIVYPRPADEQERMLVAADCFALVQGRFVPEGPLKPGETYDDELSRAAAQHTFQLPKPQAASRTSVELTGPWQVARYDDPDMDTETYRPVQELPSPAEYPLRWMGFDVPGSPWDKSALVFGHRLVYRTRVEVPAEHSGRGFFLHFSGTNWIVSVFVNGRLAGTHQGVLVPWDLDISEHVQPGRTNEIAVAVKGTYYAMDAKAISKQDRNGERYSFRRKTHSLGKTPCCQDEAGPTTDISISLYGKNPSVVDDNAFSMFLGLPRKMYYSPLRPANESSRLHRFANEKVRGSDVSGVNVSHSLAERPPAEDADDSASVVRHWNLRKPIVNQTFYSIPRRCRAF